MYKKNKKCSVRVTDNDKQQNTRLDSSTGFSNNSDAYCWKTEEFQWAADAMSLFAIKMFNWILYTSSTLKPNSWHILLDMYIVKEPGGRNQWRNLLKDTWHDRLTANGKIKQKKITLNWLLIVWWNVNFHIISDGEFIKEVSC